MKLALALIVKGDEKEAKLLDRCLDNLRPYVDDIFITGTYKDSVIEVLPIQKVCEEYGANLASFQWCNDFSKARNFNFAQVPKDCDYIIWCDADDMFRGLDTLKKVLEDNKEVDGFAFNYLYDFDEYKQPTVVHKKTQIVRNDGCITWKGKLHEDFAENRSMIIKFVEGIERMHFSTDERIESAKHRNVEVAEEDYKTNPDDPRTYWNLGNSLVGSGDFKKAKKIFEKFIIESQSDDEVFLARLRLSDIENTLGNRQKAIEHLQIAIGMMPHYSDGYLHLGFIYYTHGNLDKAEYYLRIGLVMKPQYHSLIVYNPRDYDYNPMMLLSKVYFNKHRPDKALPFLQGCLKIHPENEQVKKWVDEMSVEADKLKRVLEIVKELKDVSDKDEIKKKIESLPTDLRSHPAISSIWNIHFIKEKSSGKDLVYYCGLTDHQFNPDLFKEKGFGGSEEAVINLAKEWAKQGWNVTVYNNCGATPMTRDGVTYKPFWEYNYRDKQDVTVVWRSPKLLDYELNSTKVYVDLHDVVPVGEFNEKRLTKVDKIFVKTKSHRVLFPNIPDDKFEVIPNGMDFELFNQDVKKNQYLLVNTSSPDRSMDVLPKLFKEVKKQVPEARLKWAYGFDIFDQTFADDKKKQEWKRGIVDSMEDAGIENVGRLSQQECAKLYLEGNILVYPSEFYEIDCISVKKAQACGCMPITTDFAAFAESVQYGIKIHSKKNKDNWCKDFQFSFGLEDEKAQKEWIDAVVKQLQTPMENRTEMKEWTKKFAWDKISKKWLDIFSR